MNIMEHIFSWVLSSLALFVSASHFLSLWVCGFVEDVHGSWQWVSGIASDDKNYLLACLKLSETDDSGQNSLYLNVTQVLSGINKQSNTKWRLYSTDINHLGYI